MPRKSKGPPSKNSNPKKNRRKRKRRSRKVPRVKVPIEYDKQSQHIQLASEVEVTKYLVDEEHKEIEDEETKYNKKCTKVGNKYWDEIEMKHHGLVDDHAHHKDHDLRTTYQKTTGSPKGTHIPFDELEMKHSGYVDDHCHHLTQQELENDHGEENEKKHIQFSPDISPISSTIEESSFKEDYKATSEKAKEGKQIKLEPKVDTVNVDREKEEYSERLCTKPPHTPWDELELKDHGLVDKQGHHKQLPEDDIELHRKGQIDAKGNKLSTPKPIHRPFDEIAMKQSGYVDDHCHHMTINELQDTDNKSPIGRHVDFAESSLSRASEESFKLPTSLNKSSAYESTAKEKSSKPNKRRRMGVYRIKIKGFVNITEKKLYGRQP